MWSIFCGLGAAHLLKSQKVSGERSVGVTFCGKDTTSRVDMWAEEVAGVKYCGKCWRASMKASGNPINRYQRKVRPAIMEAFND